MAYLFRRPWASARRARRRFLPPADLHAVVAQTLGALVQAATSTAPEAAASAQTLGALVQALTGTAIDAATVSQALGDLGQAAAGAVIDTVAVDQSLPALGQTATAASGYIVTVSQALGALGQVAAGGVEAHAVAAQLLGALQQIATGTYPTTATADQLLGALGQSSAGAVRDAAVANQTLGALQQIAAGTTRAAAVASQALGALGQVAAGTVLASAVASQALGALQQLAASAAPDSAVASQVLGALGQAATATAPAPRTIVLPPRDGGSSPFAQTIAEAAAGNVVRCDLLVFFNFATAPYRLWQGFDTLITNDGLVWSGIGQLGRVGDLESSIGGTAPQTTFTLSGVDASLIADALSSSDDVKGRDVTVYLQFFDENFKCLDNPFAVWTGLMDVMRVRQTGPSLCSVELSAETIFAKRSLPPLGSLSDRDQQRVFPGDTGLALVPQMVSKSDIWPVIQPQH